MKNRKISFYKRAVSNYDYYGMEPLNDCPLSRKSNIVSAVLLFALLFCLAALYHAAPLFSHSGPMRKNSGTQAGAVINLSDAAAGELFPSLRGVKFKGTLTISAEVSLETMRNGVMPVTAGVFLQEAAAEAGTFGIDLQSRDLRLDLKGLYDAAEDRLDILKLRVHLSENGLLNIQGTVRRIRSDRPALDLRAEGRISAGEIKGMLSGPGVTWLKDLETDAQCDVSLAIAGTINSPRITGNLLVRGKKLRGKNILVQGYRLEVPFRYGGDSFTMRDVLFRADDIVHSTPGRRDAVLIRLEQAELRIPSIEYRSALTRTGIMEARIERVRAQSGDRVLHEGQDLIIRASAQYESASRTATLTNMYLNSDVLKNITGGADVVLSDPLTVNARIVYDDFSLEDIIPGLLPFFSAPAQSSIHGSGSLRATLYISVPGQGEGRVNVSLDADVRDAGFSARDETVIAEGIAATATAIAGFSLPLEAIDFTIDSRTRGFELLAGLFYGNFAGKSVDISAQGTYAPSEDALRLEQAELNLTGIGRVALAGDFTGVRDRPRFRGDISLLDVSNREGYNFFVRETFREKHPVLADMDVDGESAVMISVDGTADSFEAVGTITTSRMNIQGKEPGRFVRGLNMSLPVSISQGRASRFSGEKSFGFLRIEGISWGPLATGGIEVFPAIRANTLLFRDDIIIPLSGGTVELKKVSYADLLNPGRRLSLAVEVRGVDLALLTDSLDIPRFSGDLSGTIPSAAFAENRLVTEGEIYLSLFDGTMRISGLSADRVFSPIPSLSCSIDLDDIDLGRLTGTFEFGHISGVVRGSVRDLVIVRGQAQSFRASLESVRKKGISQKISVEALKKISILGSGTSAAILDRGIYRLFDEYRYEKLGFRGVLRNDNLRLQGIDTQDGRGYLVKGGFLPPRVDVINYNQDISFSELVRRLKRVSQAGRGRP